MDAARHQTNDATWTAKSCGPGAPTLALSSRRRIPCLAGDGGKKARFTGETTYKPLKPLRRECRLLRLNLWFCRVLFLLHADHGCSPHPAFPAPSSSDEGGLLEKLGRIAPRECDHTPSAVMPRFKRGTQYSRGLSVVHERLWNTRSSPLSA